MRGIFVVCFRVEGGFVPLRRPKVAHIATVGMGVKFLLAGQLKMLEEKGFEVWAICGPDRWAEEVRREGIRVITVPLTRSMSPHKDLKALRALVRVLRRGRFDIVHTHNPKPGFLGQVAARIARVPVSVATIHGYYFVGAKSPAAKALFGVLEAATVRMADFVFFQNRHDLELSVKLGLLPRGKAEYSGNGIDLSRFDPTKISQEEVRAERRRLGIPEDAVVVGMVGRLVWEKGYGEFLEAAILTRLLERKVQFIVAGFREDFRRDTVPMEVIRKFEKAGLLKFLGEREDMPLVYAMMDILVLPSHREGFPRALMEGAAMGKPIVATDISGCREVMKVVGRLRQGVKIGMNGFSSGGGSKKFSGDNFILG